MRKDGSFYKHPSFFMFPAYAGMTARNVLHFLITPNKYQLIGSSPRNEPSPCQAIKLASPPDNLYIKESLRKS
jgi:hypothetical protein